MFSELGIYFIGPIDGHELNKVLNTLEYIKDIEKPILLNVLTKKGKGMVSLDMKNRAYHDDAVKFLSIIHI